MKTIILLSILSTLAISTAQADQVLLLGNINNNHCAPLQHEVMLLNSPQYSVTATCSPYGSYSATNGKIYNYRLYTSVILPSGTMPGSTFALSEVFTDNCARAQALFLNLNSPQAYVNPVCSPYSYKGYAASNGRLYDYKLTTYVTVN